MPKFLRLALSVALCTSGAAAARATPVTVLIDETQSEIDVELCLQGSCGSDTSRVDGAVEIELDSYQAPSTIVLHDFVFTALDQIDLRINIFLGSLDVTGMNVVSRYGAPGTPQGPVPLSGPTFTFPTVPTDAEGIWSYQANGSMCTIFQTQSIPCSGMIDVSQLGAQPSSMTGDVTIAGQRLTLLFTQDITVPLDPTNPGFGTLRLRSSVIGYAMIPVPACAQAPRRLKGVKNIPAAEWHWQSEPNSVRGYRVYSVDRKTLLPPNGLNPVASVECSTGLVGDVTCPDANAFNPGQPDGLLYQVVGVCSDGSEGAN